MSNVEAIISQMNARPGPGGLSKPNPGKRWRAGEVFATWG